MRSPSHPMRRRPSRPMARRFWLRCGRSAACGPRRRAAPGFLAVNPPCPRRSRSARRSPARRQLRPSRRPAPRRTHAALAGRLRTGVDAAGLASAGVAAALMPASLSGAVSVARIRRSSPPRSLFTTPPFRPLRFASRGWHASGARAECGHDELHDSTRDHGPDHDGEPQRIRLHRRTPGPVRAPACASATTSKKKSLDCLRPGGCGRAIPPSPWRDGVGTSPPGVRPAEARDPQT